MPFSGEEAMGRFMDLHELFHTYTNSKFGKQVWHCCCRLFTGVVPLLPAHPPA